LRRSDCRSRAPSSEIRAGNTELPKWTDEAATRPVVARWGSSGAMFTYSSTQQATLAYTNVKGFLELPKGPGVGVAAPACSVLARVGPPHDRGIRCFFHRSPEPGKPLQAGVALRVAAAFRIPCKQVSWMLSTMNRELHGKPGGAEDVLYPHEDLCTPRHDKS